MNSVLKTILKTERMPPPYVHNLDKLTNWKTALKALKGGANTIYDVIWCGDSLSEGAVADPSNSNNHQTLGYVGRVRSKFASMFGDVGVGFVPCYYPKYGTLWTLNAGWTLEDSVGIGPTTCCASGASGTGTMTFAFTGIAIDLYYLKWSSGGDFTWKIDSGSATQVSTTYGGAEVGKTSITGLSDAAHTLTIARIADGAGVFFFGACPKTAITKGIRVNNMARWGTGTAEHFSESYADFAQNFEIPYWNPVLTCLAIVGIDAIAELSVATYTTRMQSLINLAKASGDVLLINNPVAPALAPTGVKPYSDALLGLAKTNNCAYVDLMQAWRGPYWANAKNFIYSDNTHWTLAGQYSFAQILLNEVLLV
jgi:hypothetical protein